MAKQQVMRSLGAILAIDAVGYSRQMARDEEATLKTLQAFEPFRGRDQWPRRGHGRLEGPALPRSYVENRHFQNHIPAPHERRAHGRAVISPTRKALQTKSRVSSPESTLVRFQVPSSWIRVAVMPRDRSSTWP